MSRGKGPRPGGIKPILLSVSTAILFAIGFLGYIFIKQFDLSNRPGVMVVLSLATSALSFIIWLRNQFSNLVNDEFFYFFLLAIAVWIGGIIGTVY